MAFASPSYKSVGLILIVALVGVIVVIGTVSLKNRQKAPTAGSIKSFIEPTSGIVFDGPGDWTVGKTSASYIETLTYRLEEVPSQRDTCSELSPDLSSTLQTNLKTGSQQATVTWQKEFPGLVTSQVLKGPTTLYSLVGIDTCNLSLNDRSITFRGQVYKNNVEVQFSHTVPEDSSLSPTALSQIAQTLVDGTATADLQQPFNQFVTALGSVR